MIHSTNAQPGGPLPGRAPLNHWQILLFCALWAMVSLGCATASYVTEVFRGSDNKDKAIVTMQTEIDTGVFAAIQAIDPKLTRDLVPTDTQAGWIFGQTGDGRKLIMRREFASLDELMGFPAALTSLADSDEVLVEATAVQVKEISGTLEYTFTATIVMPKPESANFAEDVNSFFSDMLPSDQASAQYKEMKNKLDKLNQALTKAGVPKFVVEVTLPGIIQKETLSSRPQGELIAADRVRWTLPQDQPGTYLLHAASRQTPLSAAEAEASLQQVLASIDDVKEFNRLMGVTEKTLTEGAFLAGEVVKDIRRELGQDPDGKKLTPREKILGTAAYLASFCTAAEGKTKCSMPAVSRALPLITRLAGRIGDDERAVAELAKLVAQLIKHDMERLRKSVSP